MQNNIYKGFALMLIISVQGIGCKKYLDEKPDKGLTVPSTLKDLQALLDRSPSVNKSTPGLLELLSDNYYVTAEDWKSSAYFDQRMNYIWDKEATSIRDWQAAYQGPVFYSNIVLDFLPKIQANSTTQNEWNSIKGSALFYRSFAFLQLAQIYCLPYSSSAGTDKGIVLKLFGDIGEQYSRSTVQQTYDQIINDFKTASELLPDSTVLPTKPTKIATYGALARTYLSMRDYINAGHYADIYLKKKNELIDYNTISSPSKFNIETSYYSYPNLYDILYTPTAKIDSTLYFLYDNNDLRKKIFFIDNGNGTHSFNGSYSGIVGFFTFDGITTDEMYLIRAECYARKGNKDAALADLNSLMIKRWNDNGSWVPFSAVDAADALTKILVERRKELVYRGLRWSDIRRLNLEGANISLKRILDGVTYSLPPNDLRSILLIPIEEINLSGISQNPR